MQDKKVIRVNTSNGLSDPGDSYHADLRKRLSKISQLCNLKYRANENYMHSKIIEISEKPDALDDNFEKSSGEIKEKKSSVFDNRVESPFQIFRLNEESSNFKTKEKLTSNFVDFEQPLEDTYPNVSKSLQLKTLFTEACIRDISVGQLSRISIKFVTKLPSRAINKRRA